jgi:DNA helicase-2/ATP-dependent DNA helicase PcrA
MNKIFKDLNDSQIEAVETVDGPLLILAGAGSGKTKTITSRLAYLLKVGIDPANTLTLTFTNKAAREMRDRALSLIDDAIYPPLLCTFHKFLQQIYHHLDILSLHYPQQGKFYRASFHLLLPSPPRVPEHPLHLRQK